MYDVAQASLGSGASASSVIWCVMLMFCAVLCCPVLWRVKLLCCVVLRCAVPCSDMLCCAVLCDAELCCCTVLSSAVQGPSTVARIRVIVVIDYCAGAGTLLCSVVSESGRAIFVLEKASSDSLAVVS